VRSGAGRGASRFLKKYARPSACDGAEGQVWDTFAEAFDGPLGGHRECLDLQELLSDLLDVLLPLQGFGDGGGELGEFQTLPELGTHVVQDGCGLAVPGHLLLEVRTKAAPHSLDNLIHLLYLEVEGLVGVGFAPVVGPSVPLQ